MHKYIIPIIFFCFVFFNLNAQENKEFEKELTSFFKDINNKTVTKKKNLFLDQRSQKKIQPENISKDSLHILLAENGFHDFNYKYFQAVFENKKDIITQFQKLKNHEINELLSDSLYNNITYCYKKNDDGLIMLEALISKRYVEIDEVKEMQLVVGTGFKKHELTFRGSSTVKNIFYLEEDNYDSLKTSKSPKKKSIDIDNKNRFKITVDATNQSEKFIAITDENSQILSVVKLY